MAVGPAECGADPAPADTGMDGQVAGSYELGDSTVVWAQGEIDLATGPDLRHQLAEATGRPSPRVLVDLTAVTFMDSTGLNALVRALRTAQAAGGDIRLVGACARVRRVIDLSRLDELFLIHATLAESVTGDHRSAEQPSASTTGNGTGR